MAQNTISKYFTGPSLNDGDRKVEHYRNSRRQGLPVTSKKRKQNKVLWAYLRLQNKKNL